MREVDIPKPDYSELRKNIPNHENTLDPRLRRILRIKDDYTEPENAFSVTPFSPPHNETELTPLNPFSSVSSLPSTSLSSTHSKSELISDPRRTRR